ncbi:hypothetical protein [Phenylobacterium sp.]|jgi:hypothetical protein|uniref:hypothetical protein n=1 Tax=Phenylobacterium sp. TaxID=1871053 RepID=UPI0037839C65
MDAGGRILALEAQLADTQRSLVAHDVLLRALLAQLALSDPAGFQALRDGLARSGLEEGEAAMREAGYDVAAMLDEIEQAAG